MRTTLLCALALVGCGSSMATRSQSANDPPPRAAFEAVDRDSDEELDDREFFEAAELYYDEWDRNEDGRLTNTELTDGVFDSWDRDRDGGLDRDELASGLTSWAPNGEMPEFGQWDTDGNDSLDREEAREGVSRARLFEAYDGNGDGVVTNLELADAVFHAWDVDGNDRVDALEWRLD
jgi:hypothetical protein